MNELAIESGRGSTPVTKWPTETGVSSRGAAGLPTWSGQRLISSETTSTGSSLARWVGIRSNSTLAQLIGSMYSALEFLREYITPKDEPSLGQELTLDALTNLAGVSSLVVRAQAYFVLVQLWAAINRLGVARHVRVSGIVTEGNGFSIEWPFADKRLGFVIDGDVAQSSWFLVSTAGHAESGLIGELGHKLDNLIERFIKA